MAPITLADYAGDASLGAILNATASYEDSALVIEYGGRTIQPGYHVTEVKAGSFVTLDCGGNPDAWRETILQVEDLPPSEGQDFLSVGKLRAILAQVGQRIALDLDARLTFEVGPPERAMQVFDVEDLRVEADRLVLRLEARSAICKPRHRAAQEAAEAAACCSTPKQNAIRG